MDAPVLIDANASQKLMRKIDGLNIEAWQVHITQPHLALELSHEAKKLSEECSYQKGLAYAIRNMGVSHRYLSNLETALSLSFQALGMFVEIGEKSGEAQAYVSIGAIYYYMGDYDRGLDYFLKGLQHAEESGNKEALTYAYNGAGYIYSTLGNHKKGLDFLQRALTLCRESQNSGLECAILDSVAVVYMNDQQLDKAYETYLVCMNLSQKLNNRKDFAYALFGIGEILAKKQKTGEAKEYFLKSLAIQKEIGYKVGMAHSLLQLGKIFLTQDHFEDAKKYLQEALDVGESIKAKAVIYEAHEAFSGLYQSTQNFELFVHHYKLFHKYKSEVFREEQETKQKYLAIQYEMEKLKQETEIDRLTNVVMKEKNAELEKKTEELEQSYNSVSLLSKMGQDITSTLNLDTILNTVYKNVNEMMDATVFGIGIYNKDKHCIEYRMSMEKGKRYQPYERTMADKNQFPVWCIENNKEVFINDIHQEYSKYLPNIDMTILSSAEMEDGTLPENPHSLIYLPLMVKDTVIGLISVQSYKKNAYTDYHLNILRTLASYTSAALYNARSYEALQGTLNELKVTQQQLVQSEKMASLGELTAGIAHEIQNPLNFVNNFSEVNRELISEMRNEIEAGNFSDAKSIARDIETNEEKIIHHGKRADAIVKSMLQHSRASSGKKEPTDINALADEYLRLSYHGLRAKDKSFNAKFETNLDNTIEKINVVPQEIGRVILNLINNAFYTVSEKKKQLNGVYEPTVLVSTKKLKDKVEIKVKDNGNGIPQKVMDKIFQPFFTTKPTGQGTGLGLSLSYDIITKGHGGELRVETEEGEGTEFIIQLPS
jgi:signal transduction histidine kinase